MPIPELSFPLASWGRIFSTAYDALIAVLKEDPELKRICRNWKTYDGHPDDMTAFNESQMPWVQMLPILPTLRLATAHDSDADFPVTMTIATEGTNVRDLMNLWCSIQGALREDRPFRDSTVRQFLRENGCYTYGAIGGGGPPGMIEGRHFTSSFTVVLKLHIPT